MPDPDRDELAELVAAFRTAEEFIAAVVYGVAVAPRVARAVRMARARAAASFIAQVRQGLDAQTLQYLRRHLPRVYLQGMTEAAIAGGAAATDVPLAWTLLHRQAITILVQDTYRDVAAATSYMDDQAKRALRKAASAEVLRQVATGQGDVGAQLARTLERQAITGFTDVAGRRWRLGRYAEMVLRTKRQAAYNTGKVLRHDQQGTVGMRVIDGTRDDDACRRANNRTCSLKWALAHPLEHPNCTRTFAPLNRIPARGFDYGSADDAIRVRSSTNPSSAILYAEPPTISPAQPGA